LRWTAVALTATAIGGAIANGAVKTNIGARDERATPPITWATVFGTAMGTKITGTIDLIDKTTTTIEQDLDE
jgi:hypothetical protein